MLSTAANRLGTKWVGDLNMEGYILHGTTPVLDPEEAVSAIAERRGISEEEAAVLWLGEERLEWWRTSHEITERSKSDGWSIIRERTK